MAATSTARETIRATRDRAKAFDMSDLIATGAIAGLVAGFIFLLANMVQATAVDKPAIAPLLAIGTIFFFDAMPQMTPDYALVGLVTHFALAILFGIIFSLLVPMFSNGRALLVGGLVYGLALYLINFQILARLVFDWFQNPMGPNQLFELIIHPLSYGIFLVPFFLGRVRRLGSPAAAREAAQGPPA